jgi:hypothetical protein
LSIILVLAMGGGFPNGVCNCTTPTGAMDVNAGDTADGTTVDLYDCNGTGAQVFIPQPNGALLNPPSGQCLDDTG